MQNFPRESDIQTESDVEQKFVWPLLTNHPPHGLNFSSTDVFTKPDIRAFEIGKGQAAKLYFPDYVVCLLGIPVLIVEAKKPGEDLYEAAREARLYAIELNACYRSGVNPCQYCIVSDGLTTQLRLWDSDASIAAFGLNDATAISPSFVTFLNQCTSETLAKAAAEASRKLRPPKYFRALSQMGGQTVQNELIPPNDFGRVLIANFQSIFNPASYEDRQKIVRNAYVESPRKSHYNSEIDRIIRNAAPSTAAESTLIEDPSEPIAITNHFRHLPSLRNKILLLVGSVGSGKSTFVDYLWEMVLSDNLKRSIAWVRVDLNPAPVVEREIYPWLRQRIINGIRESSPDIDTLCLEGQRRLYHKEIQELEAIDGALLGLDSQAFKQKLSGRLEQLRQDEVGTIKALERMLCTGRSRLLVIVLDNCDKRNRDEQLLMFQVAKYIQDEIRSLVILPLRHETFENHKHEPPLDTALKDLIFRIEPAPFQDVLRKRLTLVVKEARQLAPKTLSYHVGEKTVELSAEKIEQFLHTIIGALFEHQQYGRKIVVGLAGWNIRRAFEIFLEFCRSGFISEEEIFLRQASTGQSIALSQGVVAKVLLRTNRRNYDGDQSFVKNVFQIDPAEPLPFPLLRYHILVWLRRKTTEAGPSGMKGFHPQGVLVHDFAALGADAQRVRAECRYLAKAGCIVPEHLRPDMIEDSDLIRITPAGHVHLDLAHKDIYYLAACAEDTWVSDATVANNVSERLAQQPYWNALSWRNFLANAADFCRYQGSIQASTETRPAFLGRDIYLARPLELEEIEKKIKDFQAKIGVHRY